MDGLHLTNTIVVGQPLQQEQQQEGVVPPLDLVLVVYMHLYSLRINPSASSL